MAGVGESWENLGYIDLPGGQNSIQAMIDLGDGKVLAGTLGGFPAGRSNLYRSIDYGVTWTDLGRPIDESRISCFAYLDWGIVVAGTWTPDGKIIRSVDYGQTWTDEGQLAAESGVPSLVSLGGGVALAGTSPNRNIYRTIDYGDNWSGVCQMGGAGGNVNCMVYLGNNIVIAGTWPSSEIFRSTDNGDTWSLVGTGGGSQVYCLAYMGNGIVLAGTNNNPAEILRSIDYGATWGVINTFAPHNRIYSLVYLGNGIIIAGTGDTNGNLFRSADYGLIWTDLGQQYDANSINALIKLDDGRGLAGTGPADTYSKVLRSLVPGANGNGGGNGDGIGIGGIGSDNREKRKPIIMTHWVWKAKDGSTVDAYYAPEDIRCTQVFYDGRILSVSPFGRAVDDRTGLYSVSDITIELSNADKEFSMMLAKYFLKNQLIEAFHAWSDEAEAMKTAVLRGIVVDYWLAGTSFFVRARDVTQKYFKTKVPPEVCT